MFPDFFPHPTFAWAYVLVLVGALALLAVYDWRTLRIPNAASVGLLVVGVAFQVVRGAWVGSDGHPVWQFGANGPVVGALDALLFALAGAAVGFAWFFVTWMFGLAGGGDVKLAAAVGAWLGPLLFLVALAFTVVFLALLTAGRAMLRLLSGQRVARIGGPRRHTLTDEQMLERRMMSYSLPFALGVALTLFGIFAVELGLLPRPPG